MPDADANSVKKPLPEHGERHVLKPETELRLEVPINTTATITLLQGSAEIFGAEMCCAPLDATSAMDTIKQSYRIYGHTKLAIFTWHGCTVDVEVEFGKSLEISYTSDETACNIAYVNTHTQLEAMRDEALNHNMKLEASSNNTTSDNSPKDGPRVLIVGPADSGKTSLARLLSAYAVKLGRSPLLVDLDVSQNMLSVPGTITASPMTPASVSATTHANSGTSIASGSTPFVLWYGSTKISANPDLYKALLEKLGDCINARLSGDVDARSSGMIINACGWIEDIGYKMLLNAVDSLNVNVLLVMGHDRLYSMLNSYFTSQRQSTPTKLTPKLIKLPRSGGVVSRDDTFRRISRNSSIKRYFYGDYVRVTNGPSNFNPLQAQMALQYTPTLLQIPFYDLTLYKLSSVSLAASMLPVSAKQATEPVQLSQVDASLGLKHVVLAVCHPSAVESYKLSRKPSDLYLSAITGLVSVENIDMDKEILSILSPCAGSLPSTTLLLGDITWMD